VVRYSESDQFQTYNRRIAVNRLHIRIKDDSKIPLILSLLREFPFVEIEENTERVKSKGGSKGKGGLADLFGLWAHKDVTLNEIRKKAWSRRGL
jgi:hypothetical protein